jgi:hypothetical protein
MPPAGETMEGKLSSENYAKNSELDYSGDQYDSEDSEASGAGLIF